MYHLEIPTTCGCNGGTDCFYSWVYCHNVLCIAVVKPEACFAVVEEAGVLLCGWSLHHILTYFYNIKII